MTAMTRSTTAEPACTESRVVNGSSVVPYADDSGRALNLQIERFCPRRIHGRDLGSCVNEKVVGAAVIDGDRNDNLNVFDEPQA